jgi:hypothetical protein
MGLLHSRTAEHDPDRPEPPAPAPDRVPSAVEALARRARGLPGEAGRRGSRLAGALARPWGLAAEAVDGAVAVARALRHSDGSAPGGSPLLAARSGRWRFELLEVGFDALREGAAAAGGSVNDALVAAVVEAFRRYHLELGVEPGELVVGVPVNLRTPDDPPGGNRLAAATLRTSMRPTAPADRVHAVREFVLEAGAPDPVPPLVGRAVEVLPGALRNAAVDRSGDRVDVRVGALAGVGHAVHLAGPRIGRVFPYGPLAGAAASIGLVPHDGTCCVGLTLDPAAITRPDVLVAALDAALAEVCGQADRGAG